jgi:DNA-binding NarL/FixJ family response regulator
MTPDPRAIRVVIADDHAVVRVGLHALIANEPDMAVVGEAADGAGAVAQVRALRPDVLLLDLVMPGMQGVQVIEELAATAPEVRVLVLTMFDDDEHVFAALGAGACGYLLKESALTELTRGIRDVAAGKLALHPAVARRILQRYAQPPRAPASEVLTPRERQVLALVAQGLSNKTIARRLGLSDRTARTYVSAILAKLRLRSRTEATLYALRTGLMRLEEQPQ